MIKIDNILYDPDACKFYVRVNGSLMELTASGGNDEGSEPDSGVTQVDALPDTGEEGKIYYNTTDGKYYTFNGDEYSELGCCLDFDTPTGVVESSGSGGLTTYDVTFTIKDNTYSDLGTVGTPTTGQNIHIEFADSSVLHRCIGCFKISSQGSASLHLPLGISFPTDLANFTFDSGHTYEFNILYNTCLVHDITSPGKG